MLFGRELVNKKKELEMVNHRECTESCKKEGLHHFFNHTKIGIAVFIALLIVVLIQVAGAIIVWVQQ